VASRDLSVGELTRRLSLGGIVALFTAALVIFLLPQLTSGCDEKTAENVERVTIKGETFFLELALDDETRFKGLSGRTHIEPDGGMLFVFPNASVRQFVMRDCFTDIDIIYLDGSGRVVAQHAMVKEPPRGPGEGEVGEINRRYENRLRRYSSRHPAQFVIELAPGSLDRLELSEGDRIDLDIDRLKRIAR